MYIERFEAIETKKKTRRFVFPTIKCAFSARETDTKNEYKTSITVNCLLKSVKNCFEFFY